MDNESSWDTTYVSIMLVVFIVVAGLAIDIGYMYVSEEDLQATAENSALAGAEALKHRILAQAQKAPEQLQAATGDLVQSSARNAVVETVSGKNKASALMEVANANTNALTVDNDITVGNYNQLGRTYTPGVAPVNAVQVRTKRTAESASVGLGSLGTFLAKATGTESFGSTPVAVAALPIGTRSNLAFCEKACEPACSWPKICDIAERHMTPAWPDTSAPQGNDRYLFTSLLRQVGITNTISDLVCQESPQQEVCGSPIYVAAGSGTAQDILRDIKAKMYDPKADSGNKEYDKSGKLVGWWMVAPVTDCSAVKAGDIFEPRRVTRYAMVRVSRICVSGPAGCGDQATQSVAPAVACRPGEQGLYIDRISCVGCAEKEKVLFPGLHPVLVGQ
ncbi:hypothetical protein GMSM_36660 [Geomonas sp. Red276]